MSITLPASMLGNVDGLFVLGLLIEENDGVTRKGFGIDGDPVQVEGSDDLVKIMGMQWNERYVTDTVPVVSEAKGTPRLVLQQLDENGERTAGKVIVAEKLQAWKVDDDGRVMQVKPRGDLSPEPCHTPAAQYPRARVAVATPGSLTATE